MRKLALFLLLASSVLPAFAVKRVSVSQLEQVLTASEHKPDSKAVQELTGLQLTERLSPARLAYWESALPGPESRRVLAVLADISAFLDPPAAEIPAKPHPDFARQRQIMALAVDYVARTTRQFPNLFATRDTIRFEDSPATQAGGGLDGRFSPYEPLHPVSRSRATVLYLNGREVVESGKSSGGNSEATSKGLTTRGEFGPILTTVLIDAAHGTLTWSHWEHGPMNPVAVFRFSVPIGKSHYQVEFCCIAGLSNNGVFQQFSAYHGEIAIDPADGTILRLTLIADLRKIDPVVTSDILVDYGPVTVGGKTYICPIKSISMSLAPVQVVGGMRMQNAHGVLTQPTENGIPPPLQTMLNEVEFEQYHLFHAVARVLTDGNEKSGANAAAPVEQADAGNITGVTAGNSDAVEKPAPVAAEKNPVIRSGAAVASASETPTAIRAATPVAIPEISVTGSPALPGAPDSPLSSGKNDFTLHVTTHIVSVGVVALDKKGHPVTDLQAEDFQVYDNGRKQTVRFFSHAARAPDGKSAPGPERPDDASEQLVISNRPSNMVSANGTSTTEAGVTILLIDANNLAWADFTYARSAILKFLQSLRAGERVGLYVQSGPGFQVLAEGTADHALLASTLRRWMPDAKALAQAQETERRNRQQFDYVAHPSDLQYVNGNMNSAPDGDTSVDPKLRSQGSTPDRDTLSILEGVARHLEGLSGHKNVVWVTSDNALANWSDQAVNMRMGGQSINGLVLRAQEALNDAHASLYPLDASQLETMAVDPSLANNNVEVSPGVTTSPPPQGGGAGSG
ncbi:MAG: VWA domain-containing protein, partial [Acidobacteriaceae bacterium]